VSINSIVVLLEGSGAYTGEEAAIDGREFMTFNMLRSKAQISRVQLQKYLGVVNAVEVNGNVRLLDQDLLYDTVGAVLDSVIENNWGIGKVADYDLKRSQVDRSEIFVNTAIKLLGGSAAGGEYWSFDKGKISAAAALVVLRDKRRAEGKDVSQRLSKFRIVLVKSLTSGTVTSKTWSWDELRDSWSCRLPNSCETDPALLRVRRYVEYMRAHT